MAWPLLAERVLITEAVHASLDPLGRRLQVDLQEGLWADPAGLRRAAGDCAALVVRNQTRVDAELIQAARGLRVVGRLGAGLDNLDLEALAARSVTVVHGGGLNARAVAEYVVGALLVLARGLAASDRAVRAGGWARQAGFELRGRTLGIVGLGRTGQEAARLGRRLGMRVLGYDPHAGGELPGIGRASLLELCRRSRAVSVHVPLVPATSGLIGEREIRAMAQGAILVNAARGGVVDEDALYRALRDGHLGGAALDVRSSEPPPPPDRFSELENVLLTPHLAGLTEESQSAIAAHVLGGVRRALAGRAGGRR